MNVSQFLIVAFYTVQLMNSYEHKPSPSAASLGLMPVQSPKTICLSSKPTSLGSTPVQNPRKRRPRGQKPSKDTSKGSKSKNLNSFGGNSKGLESEGKWSHPYNLPVKLTHEGTDQATPAREAPPTADDTMKGQRNRKRSARTASPTPTSTSLPLRHCSEK